jgi:dCTP deaminase
MPILSDEQITQRCVPPTEVLDEDRYWLEKGKPQSQTLAYNTDPRKRMIEDQRRDAELLEQCKRPLTEEERAAFEPMIEPFHPELIRHACALDAWNPVLDKGPAPEGVRLHQYIPERKIISHGLTSYGYDVSLSKEGVEIFTNINSTIIDPKRFDADRCLVDAQVRKDEDGALYVVLPPHSYLLGRTVEYFRMPRDVIAVCLGKSTYARTAIAVNVTPIEPGFHGNVVIEVANLTSLPAKIYLEEGISQFLFLSGSPCKTSYADRGGKYQGQTGVTMAKV